MANERSVGVEVVVDVVVEENDVHALRADLQSAANVIEELDHALQDAYAEIEAIRGQHNETSRVLGIVGRVLQVRAERRAPLIQELTASLERARTSAAITGRPLSRTFFPVPAEKILEILREFQP